MGLWSLLRSIFNPKRRTPVAAAPAPQVAKTAEPLAAPKPEASARSALVVLGVDLGTSSTKVAFRLVGERVAWIPPSGEPHERLPWFCTSSTSEVVDGHVYFSRGVSTRDYNIKLSLLDSSLPKDEFGTAERRAVAYIGWLVQQSVKVVRQQFRIAQPRIVLNLAVPVAYFADRDTMRAKLAKYEQVGCAAFASTTIGGGAGIMQGMPVVDLDRIVDDSIKRRAAIDQVAILPESVAALVSLQADPMVEAGLYSVIDIGAGTTEVSTSLLAVRPTGVRAISCYLDSMEYRGALQLEEALGQDDQMRALLNAWWKQWVANWDGSRMKDRANRHQHGLWRKTTLLFTGGGGCRPEVKMHFEKALRKNPPAQKAFQDWDVVMVPSIYQPSRQAIEPVGDAPIKDRGSFNLLTVAHGLAHHRREWPAWYRPDDIEPIEAPERADLPWDSYEAGYSGR